MQQVSMFEVMFDTFKFDRNREITVVETFAGIGSQRKALDRLAKELGLKIKYLDIVEYDKYCIQSYNAIHGTNHIKKDITQTHGNDFKEQIDIFTYSFPCQDISLAGNQKGFSKGSNTRSGLLWEVERILKELKHKPKVLLMENVKNLIGEQFIGDFQEWVRELENLGYTNYYQVLNAKNYGIPQNRERVFMVSILGEYNYNFPQPFPLKLRLKDMLEDEVDEKYYLSEKQIENIIKSNFIQNTRRIQKDDICDTLCARDYKDPKCIRIGGLYDKDGQAHQAGGIYDTNGVSPTLTDMQGGNRQPLLKIPEATKKGYAVAQDGDSINLEQPNSETRRGRVGKQVAQTLTCNNNQATVTDQYRIRKLTPLECYRLMGFDDEDFYKAAKVCSNTQLYKQAGNSIVVNVLESIFKQLF